MILKFCKRSYLSLANLWKKYDIVIIFIIIKDLGFNDSL